MKYEELTQEQKNYLAGDYLVQLANEGKYARVMGVDHDAPSYEDMSRALDLVGADVMEREFGSYDFTEDDFPIG